MEVIKMLVAVVVTMFLAACGGSAETENSFSSFASVITRTKKAQGVVLSNVMQVQLPFVDGRGYKCTQNSEGTTSHFYESTRYDLDFALPFGSIVVAMADGIVRIYNDLSKTSGFGWYIRIEHENGYWTIYAHLSGFIARDGDRVVAGQPIAYSGGKLGGPGSGSSTGPHLHIGVHSGSGIGESQPMLVYAQDVNTGNTGWFGTVTPSDFICGLTNGHTYSSRPIGRVFSDYQCSELANNAGLICWYKNPTTCEDGRNHVRYYKNNEGAFVSESNSDSWKWCLQRTTNSANAFSYLEGGYGVGGVGPGNETLPTDAPIQGLPDFITRSFTVYDSTESAGRYVFLQTEQFRTKAVICNVGDAD